MSMPSLIFATVIQTRKNKRKARQPVYRKNTNQDGNINETVDISGIQIEGEEEGIPTDALESEENQQEALKKLSNVKHYKINMNGIHNQFLVGVGLMSEVASERKEKQKKERKHRDHVDAAVEHFRDISQHQ